MNATVLLRSILINELRGDFMTIGLVPLIVLLLVGGFRARCWNQRTVFDTSMAKGVVQA